MSYKQIRAAQNNGKAPLHIHDERQEKFELLRSQLSVATTSLESISKNSCCEQCQQAKLVAKQALEKIKGISDEKEKDET